MERSIHPATSATFQAPRTYGQLQEQQLAYHYCVGLRGLRLYSLSALAERLAHIG